MSVNASRRKIPDLWATRDELAGRQWASKAVWDSIDDPRRAAVLVTVGNELLRLLATLSEWVPLGLTLRDPSALEVHLNLVLEKIDDGGVAELVGAEMEKVRALEEMREMKKRLEASRG